MSPPDKEQRMHRIPGVTRRQFLRAMGFGAGWVGARRFASGGDDRSMLIIDCHAHIYGEDEAAYPPLENPLRPPQGTGTLAHLKREMAAIGARYATAIQTSTFYRWDNRFTADAARANRDLLVGVVTLNPDDPRSPEMLATYVNDYNVRGMRSIPAESGRLDDPAVDRLWGTAERLGIVINVLVNRDKRGEVEALAARHPQLPIVIDHCLNLRAGPTARHAGAGGAAPGPRQADVRPDGQCRAVSLPGYAFGLPGRD
jgi:predicted TIM-barrel fold metal-dependent hydrolase